MPPALDRKNVRIASFVRRLRRGLEPALWRVQDHWEGDLLAIGIASTADAARLAWVTARGLAHGRYTLILEDAPPAGSDLPYVHVGEHEDVSFDEAVGIIRRHVTPRPGDPSASG